MRGLLAVFAVAVLSAESWTKAAEVEVSVGSVKREFVGATVYQAAPRISDLQTVSRGYLVRVDDDIAVVVPSFDRLGGVHLQVWSFAGLGVQADLGRKGRTVTNLTGTGPHIRSLALAPESSATAIFRREGKLDSSTATWRGKFVSMLIPIPPPEIVTPMPVGLDPKFLPYVGHMSETLTVKTTRSGSLTTSVSTAQNLTEAVVALRAVLFGGRLGTNSEQRWGTE